MPAIHAGEDNNGQIYSVVVETELENIDGDFTLRPDGVILDEALTPIGPDYEGYKQIKAAIAACS